MHPTPIFLRYALRFSRLRLVKVLTSGGVKKIEIPIMFRMLSGLTFDQIAKAIGRDEVWVASAFYAQVSIR